MAFSRIGDVNGQSIKMAAVKRGLFTRSEIVRDEVHDSL
jgi:hypothetical protein